MGRGGNRDDAMTYRPKSERLMDQVREVLRYYHYGLQTEKAYVRWILGYIRFHHRRHPKEMGKSEIEAYLSHLAINRNVSASTQNQALSALIFLYKRVLFLPAVTDASAARSKKSVKLPTVLSVDEVQSLMVGLTGRNRLIAELIYGSGFRLMELLRLRVHNIDFANQTISIFDAKGGKNRVTLLPPSVVDSLRQHLESGRVLHETDRRDGVPGVSMPDALARKYRRANESWEWFWVFPSKDLSTDPRMGI